MGGGPPSGLVAIDTGITVHLYVLMKNWSHYHLVGIDGTTIIGILPSGRST